MTTTFWPNTPHSDPLHTNKHTHTHTRVSEFGAISWLLECCVMVTHLFYDLKKNTLCRCFLALHFENRQHRRSSLPHRCGWLHDGHILGSLSQRQNARCTIALPFLLQRSRRVFTFHSWVKRREKNNARVAFLMQAGGAVTQYRRPFVQDRL